MIGSLRTSDSLPIFPARIRNLINDLVGPLALAVYLVGHMRAWFPFGVEDDFRFKKSLASIIQLGASPFRPGIRNARHETIGFHPPRRMKLQGEIKVGSDSRGGILGPVSVGLCGPFAPTGIVHRPINGVGGQLSRKGHRNYSCPGIVAIPETADLIAVGCFPDNL